MYFSLLVFAFSYYKCMCVCVCVGFRRCFFRFTFLNFVLRFHTSDDGRPSIHKTRLSMVTLNNTNHNSTHFSPQMPASSCHYLGMFLPTMIPTILATAAIATSFVESVKKSSGPPPAFFFVPPPMSFSYS